MVAVGIDLGTTHSCVAVFKEGNVEVIANELGNRTTPSIVAFTPRERLIGEAARNQAASNPRNTIFGAKRLIGRRFDDVGVQLDLRHWPFLVTNDNGKPQIVVEFKGRKKVFAPEEISGMILFRMKEVAEAFVGEKIIDAVVTVPAYFNDAQRQATRTAGSIAGLNVIRVINEPTAAALAYGLDKNVRGEKNVLIYDLGGGTVDVSILTIGEGSVYEVKATAGNSRLGGEDFDNRLVAYIAEDFRKKYGREILNNSRALRRAKTAAEKAKKFLTSAMEATIQIESLYDNIDYVGCVSRALFEELCSDLFRDTLKSVEQALSGARLQKADIHEIILVGGSTRIPKIRSLVQDFFDGRALTTSINPDESIACGAAVQAAILSGQNEGNIQDLLLIDVVPLSLGVETARGMMFKVIERNTPIPCRFTKELTTLEDYQNSMTIEVFEGERALTSDNNLLGVFDLSDIPPAPRGVAKIDVTFDVDANGILTVSAQDRSTGNRKGITIANNHRLTQTQISKMIADAQAYREEDTENKLRLEVRNQLETYVYSIKQSVVENKRQISEKEKSAMVRECKKAITWLEENPDCLREEYERKMSELLRRWSRVIRKLNGQNLCHINKRQRNTSELDSELGDHETTIEEVEELFELN
ncbi:heat shock protein 68-like isoform X1 [Epargyreus clarus]|uniref:heat shock protein 68-like isoform X1 n=2 Tax=Epargyreus clarus TaxID=520877 RepID=UPI003C2F79FE